MATFNTSTAKKAWEKHSKDLLQESKLSVAQQRYKSAAEKLDASQAKILNGELLKMSKAIGKALDQLGKQQSKIQDKQKQLDDLERYQGELAKEIKELSKDTKLDAKKRAEALRKNEAEMKAADKKVAAIHESMEELEGTLNDKLDEFSDDLQELEDGVKLTVEQASTKLGKSLIAKAKAEAKEREKKDLLQARLQSKNIQEVLDKQLAELHTAFDDAADQATKDQIKNLRAEMGKARGALERKDYASYLAAQRSLKQISDSGDSRILKRLDDIKDWTEQEQDFRKEKKDRRWDRIEKVAGALGLGATASLFRPKEKTNIGIGEKLADALGLSRTAGLAKKGLSYGASFAKGASKKVLSPAISGISRLGKAGASAVMSAVARIKKPKEESPVAQQLSNSSPTGKSSIPRDARGRFVKRSHLPEFKKAAPAGKSIAAASTAVIAKSSQAADARAEDQANEEVSLLRRQVAALEKIAGGLKKGGKGESGGSLLNPKTMWNLLKKLGGKLLGRFGGLLTRAISFIGPALSAIAGPLATVAGAAAVGYATYKATSWIMKKLNIDPGKLGTGLYDLLHGDEEKKQAEAQAKAEAEAAARGKAKRAAAEAAKSTAEPIKLPDSGMGGGRGRVNPPMAVPQEGTPTEPESGKSLADAAVQLTTKPSEAYTPTTATPSNIVSSPAPSVASSAPTPPPTTNPIVVPSSTGAGAGRGSAYMDKAGTSLSEAAGKLFKTSKSGEALDGVNPAVQSNFTAMAAEYKSQGGKGTITLNSAYRSQAEQAKLYKENPSKAAPPGKSAHGSGLALDINSREANELDKMGLLSKYGFARPVPGEAWHLQAKGTAVALAKAGAISADSASDQSVVTSSGKSANAAPVTEKLPAPATTSQPQEQMASSAMQGRQQMATAGSAPKGSAGSIPNFSFLDGGFFVMNTGMMV